MYMTQMVFIWIIYTGMNFIFYKLFTYIISGTQKEQFLYLKLKKGLPKFTYLLFSGLLTKISLIVEVLLVRTIFQIDPCGAFCANNSTTQEIIFAPLISSKTSNKSCNYLNSVVGIGGRSKFYKTG